MSNVPTIKFTKLFINGHFVDSISGRTFETIDPRTEEVMARVSEGDKEEQQSLLELGAGTKTSDAIFEFLN